MNAKVGGVTGILLAQFLIGCRADSGVLTQKQIAELKERWKDDASGRKIELHTTLEPVGPAKSEPIRYRLTVALYEYGARRGMKRGRRLPGTAHFYMLNAKNEVLMDEAMSLAKLCPS